MTWSEIDALELARAADAVAEVAERLRADLDAVLGEVGAQAWGERHEEARRVLAEVERAMALVHREGLIRREEQGGAAPAAPEQRW